VVTIGLLISNMITRPLVEIAQASTQVAEGNLNTFVSTTGNDEIGVLARSFNRLVAGLRESLPYRDAVMPVLDPEILAEMQSGQMDDTLKSEGFNGEATVLAADVSSFTRGIDVSDPKFVLSSLNEYYEAMVPTINQHGGVISQFDGETLIAFFGLSPKQLPPSVSAMQGVHAGLELIQLIDQWNSDRAVRGDPALEAWIGISTGSVIAGHIGDQGQMKLNVIGDTVQEARDLQDVCRELGEGSVLISENSYEFLEKVREQFKFGRYGQTQLRHSGNEIKVYEVRGRRTSFVRSGRGSGENWTGENG
jgi:adenylate cyclase